jgi:GAF domain-containing protein
MLVPQFADHCVIDLFQGEALIRRVQRHAGGWTPPLGTWTQVGEQIRYPQGHFCQRAMARLDTVIVTDLAQDRGDRYPPPSARSMVAAKQVGLTSVLAAPLYARGVLLGVMSLALSDLTDRTERNYAAADRYLIGAIASQVAVAIDDAITVRGRVPDRAGPSSIAPATSWP